MSIFIDTPEMMGVAASFLTQVGARHLVFNFSAIQQKIITHPITQGLIMFGMFYISTRRLTFAVGLLVLYYLLIMVLLNENHPLNIIPRQWLISEGFLDANEKSPIDQYYENVRVLTNS
jgi:hypothetical protein